MVAGLVASRAFRWSLALACGPLTAPLALQAMRYAREGDRIAAFAYAVTIPAVWLHLSILATLPWTP